ncbi:uncharacterized protein LOC111712147 isoform X2 [Eurytemora carolleeae]|uniref:uncharacterized protein LOC111712147 isoform X2 n=1 Tax=Eurytemora carolleeae TaxID=1294199 RepID=UPI000C776370|nr:uncharacterized protein LOC111712147 isoform X2 [Eurytemora carolleeae]|eukprot:XP_023342454.1 uncharacterized protein LOC111712147 isoform X2 [Eurytemora affinis]
MMATDKKHVVIIGGGIIGLTTAYELSKHFKVTLVEKEKEVCLGASFQNGGVINVESITPVNSYLSFSGVLKSSLISLVSSTPSNTFLRPSALLQPNFFLWVKHFFLNTSQERILYHSKGMMEMGLSLKRKLLERKVEFIEGEVSQVITNEDEVQGLKLKDGGLVAGDLYVVSAGYQSSRILKNIEISIPLMPIKAYSLHLPSSRAAKNWKYAVHIDSSVAGLFTPYREGVDKHELRVTGIRDMDGDDPTLRLERVKHLTEVAERFTGDNWRQEEVRVWCGIMPVSPDDFPVIGGTRRYSNLFLNVGHGFRGTAYSLPSARLLSQLLLSRLDIEQERTRFCFNPKFADPSRFGI